MVKQKIRRITEKQATEDNQNIKEKDHRDYNKERETTMKKHENTPGTIHDSQPKFPAQVRPPEENPTARQATLNEERGHDQIDTNRNNKQNTKKIRRR